MNEDKDSFEFVKEFSPYHNIKEFTYLHNTLIIANV